MKKLITLLLVLTGMVQMASAADLTIYLKAGVWQTNDAAFAVWNQVDGTWIKFTQLRGEYYTAVLPEGYTKINLVRYDKTLNTPSWAWGNQTTDITVDPSKNYYKITGWEWSNFTENAAPTRKIYVRNMEDEDAQVCLYLQNKGDWSAIYGWPGASLTEEIIDGKKWYSFLNLEEYNTVFGNFTQKTAPEGKENYISGGFDFDLSTSDLYFNYYPSNYQAVVTSEALATPAVLHFRSNNGASPLKYYWWNNSGMSDKGFTTTSAGGATDWVTITSYKPGFSIQFYTYDNGGTDTDKSEGIDITGLTGGENHYYFAKLNANNATGEYQYDGKGIMKMNTSYYLVYSDGWEFDPSKETWAGSGVNQTVGAVQLTPNAENGFLFEGILDNTNGKKNYYAIVPASDWDGAIKGWDNLISPAHTEVTDSKYTIDAFKVDQVNAMPTTWCRWANYTINTKFNIQFNFATMTWKSTPYFERDLTEGYATFSSDFDVAIPEDITAYYATGATIGKVTMTSISNGIKADQGAFLKVDNTDTYKFTPATTTDSGTNLLVKGSDADIPASTDGSYNYVYAIQGGIRGFYNVGTPVTQDMTGKAYLHTSEDIKPTEQGARISIIFDDDETTGIKQLETSKQSVEGYFNLAGQRVAQPTKGLYIVNGKKVIIK